MEAVILHLTEYLPQNKVHFFSWVPELLYIRNKFFSFPVIFYASKGEVITLKGPIRWDTWLFLLWVTLWRLKTSRRQQQVGQFSNLNVNQDSDSSTAFLGSTLGISHLLTHTHQHVHTLLLPVRVLVVDVESLGGAQQLWKKTRRQGRTGEGRQWKKTISIYLVTHFSLNQSALQKSLHPCRTLGVFSR